MHLVCRQCSTRLTTEPQLVPFDPRSDAVEEEFLARGNLMQAEKSFYFETNDASFIPNIADTQHMKLLPATAGLQGCCGLDGCNVRSAAPMWRPSGQTVGLSTISSSIRPRPKQLWEMADKQGTQRAISALKVGFAAT